MQVYWTIVSIDTYVRGLCEELSENVASDRYEGIVDTFV